MRVALARHDDLLRDEAFASGLAEDRSLSLQQAVAEAQETTETLPTT